MSDINFQDLRLAQKYKHFIDDRTKQEKQLSIKVVHSLTELNLALLKTQQPKWSNKKTISKNDFLYVCLPGLPPFKDQFSNLQLPGQTITFEFISASKQVSPQELMDYPVQMMHEAERLHKKIQSCSTNKPLVFIYHSFGTYILASYLWLYKPERVIGMIDMGGAPVRFYPFLRDSFRAFDQVPLEQLKNNIDIIHQNAKQRSQAFNIATYPHKQQSWAFIKTCKGEFGFAQMFQYIRRFPKVLKCIVIGRKDSIFPQELLSEKIIHFLYRVKFTEHYNELLQQKYQKIFGRKLLNIQQSFVYSIEDGFHSIHIQRKQKALIKNITHRYLNFLEEIMNQQQPKL